MEDGDDKQGRRPETKARNLEGCGSERLGFKDASARLRGATSNEARVLRSND